MKILVANLGSTSFKFRLLQMSDEAAAPRGETELARGGTERIGGPSRSFATIGPWSTDENTAIADHAAALRWAFARLTAKESGCIGSADEIAAIGFKAVHGGRITGVQRVTDDVLAAMDEMSSVAPAHNPPYVAAMRLLRDQFPTTPLVAAFETDFHQTIPPRNRAYAIDPDLAEKCHIARHGFHGASHRYIAQRIAIAVGTQRRPDHFVPPGRIEFVVCHPRRTQRRHNHGHEPADRLAARDADW